MLLALDPGAARLGWAALHEGELVGYGSIQPEVESKQFNKKLNERIQFLLHEFESIFEKYQPDEVAWETVPSFGSMAQREQITACATVFKTETFRRRIPYTEYTPAKWKAKLVGRKAPKEDVRRVVMLKFPELVPDMPFDVYDAIGLAVVHAESAT